MEPAVLIDPSVEITAMREEIQQLKLNIKSISRELGHRDRTITTIENNLSIRMNMLRSLAAENDKRQRFLTHMMKSSVDFLILLDIEHNIAYCSDIFLDKIGVRYLTEIEGKNIFEIYSKFADNDLLEILKNGLKEATVINNNTYRHDITADIDKSGIYRAYRITNTPMLDEDLTFQGVIIDWHDTTDIINAKNEAEKANRSKSDFLASMSHEIRTPMNAIIGIVQIEIQKDNLPEEYTKALERIYNSGNNLLGIINDILDLSKIESGNLELVHAEFNLPGLINDAVQINIIRIGSKEIEFIVDADINLPLMLYGDELCIKQILNNILSNAIKYTDKGFVKLSINHSMINNEDVHLRFTVEDTGQGMKEEDLKNLFSEYQRFNLAANRSTEGTGLGLPIARKLVGMMDGKIEVKSEYGKGSTFTITVKQKAVKCGVIGEEISAKLKNFTFSGERQSIKQNIIRDPMPYGKVLIVDDVETNLFVAQGLLSPYKLEIETVNSGFAAINLINAGNTYDIIFMDHMMPQMDGIETTQKIRSLGYDGTIIALTANALTGNKELFLKNKFDGFISKPIDLRYLNSVLNEFIRDKHPEKADNYKPESINEDNDSPMISPKVYDALKRDIEKAIVALREAAASGNIKLFTITAHSMKSALAMVYEDKKSEMAFNLEKAGNEGNIEYINANTENFIQALNEIYDTKKNKG